MTEFPEFGLSDGVKSQQEREYLMRKYSFGCEIETMLEWDRKSETPQDSPEFPTFYEFFEPIASRLAQEWCERESIEWYTE